MSNRLKDFKTKGIEPDGIILTECAKIDLRFWEDHFIDLFRSWGFVLDNASTKSGYNRRGLPVAFGEYVYRITEESKKSFSWTIEMEGCEVLRSTINTENYYHAESECCAYIRKERRKKRQQAEKRERSGQEI